MYIEVHKDLCSGCGVCVDTCSEHHFGKKDPQYSAIIILEDRTDKDSFIPVVCDNCGKCADACPTGIIEKNNEGCYIIDKEACLMCTMCVSACPKKLIRENHSLEAQFKCDLCLKCTEVCPTGALVAVE
ncbi:4Fe-4S binding protein [Spirochaetota bacterium]